jgi:hypothetical protein
VNAHVIFSDEVSPDTIERFFLDKLSVALQLADGEGTDPAFQARRATYDPIGST